MTEKEPNLINSSKSQKVDVDGYPFSIEIYRIETDKTWTLGVVDHEGTSHVWDEQFRTDKDARNAALQAFEAEGAVAFMRGDNVIPFRRGYHIAQRARRHVRIVDAGLSFKKKFGSSQESFGKVWRKLGMSPRQRFPMTARTKNSTTNTQPDQL